MTEGMFVIFVLYVLPGLLSLFALVTSILMHNAGSKEAAELLKEMRITNRGHIDADRATAGAVMCLMPTVNLAVFTITVFWILAVMNRSDVVKQKDL